MRSPIFAEHRPDTFRSVPRFSTHFERPDRPQISPGPVILAPEFRNLDDKEELAFALVKVGGGRTRNVWW